MIALSQIKEKYGSKVYSLKFLADAGRINSQLSWTLSPFPMCKCPLTFLQEPNISPSGGISVGAKF